MHVLLMILLLAQTQGGIISGRIVSLDGTPAAQKRIVAQAILNRDDVALGASMLAGLSQTDNDGRFILENVPPGRYYIVLDPLETPSFYPGVNKQERATIVSVAEGSLIEGVNFKIPDFDGGKVFGRLATPPGPPLGSMSSPVRVALLKNNPGQPILAGLGSSVIVRTISFSAGGVIFSLGSNQTVSAPVNADGTFELPKVRSGTYSISTIPDIGLSTAVVDIGEADVYGVELAVPGTTPATTTGVSVRGRLSENPVPQLLSQLSVLLGGSTTASSRSRVSISPDGTFVIPNVQPGTYTAMTVPSPNVSRHTTLEVADQNISNLELVPPYTVEVPGHVEIEGGVPLKAGSSITVDASHVDIKPFRTIIPADGNFKLNLLSGDNWIILRNVPVDLSVVSMTYGGYDVLRHPLRPDLGDTGGIRIYMAPVSPDSFHNVRGKVDGLPAIAIGPDTKVVLTGNGDGRRIVETPVKPDGAFEFSRVPPDTYTARVVGALLNSDPVSFVSAADVDDLRIKGEIRGDVSGRVQIVDRNGTILPNFPFSYMTAEFSTSGSSSVTAVQPDGTFSVTLAGGEYRLLTNTLPDSYTLKAATAGGADIVKGKLKIDGRLVPGILVTLEYRPKPIP